MASGQFNNTQYTWLIVIAAIKMHCTTHARSTNISHTSARIPFHLRLSLASNCHWNRPLFLEHLSTTFVATQLPFAFRIGNYSAVGASIPLSTATAAGREMSSKRLWKCQGVKQCLNFFLWLQWRRDSEQIDYLCVSAERDTRFRTNQLSSKMSFWSFWRQGPGWEYETELPDWAKIDWVDYDCE